jgi:hypothetical protein
MEKVDTRNDHNAFGGAASSFASSSQMSRKRRIARAVDNSDDDYI